MANRVALKIDVNDVEVSRNVDTLSRSSTPSSTQNTDNFGLPTLRDQFENLRAANNAQINQGEAERETAIYKTLLKNSQEEKELLHIENKNLKEQILQLEESKEESKYESKEESKLEETMDTALGEFSSFDSFSTEGVNTEEVFWNRYSYEWAFFSKAIENDNLKDFSNFNINTIENILRDPSSVCIFKLNYLRDNLSLIHI